MTISITKKEFKENFPLLFEDISHDDEIKNVLKDLEDIPDNIWKAITYISEIYISADNNSCVLSDSLRTKGIYLTIAVYLLKTIFNVILRRNGSQITSAKEGEVSVTYQDIPNTNVRDWFLTDPNVQPFGALLWQILQTVQPCPVVNLSYPAPYYDTWGF